MKYFLLLFYLNLSFIKSKVILGNEILRNNNYNVLNNHRIAILTNPTGIFQDTLQHIVDNINLISKNDNNNNNNNNNNINLVAIFGPEHGFRGDKQAETGDKLVYIDNETKLPVFSAYNMNPQQISKVIEEMNITAIVVDMQDVGVRLYTFIWTMYDVMVAASQKNVYGQVTFIICDRPNPLGGLLVNGPMLNISCCRSGYGEYPIPHIHGLTIAELALLFNQSPEINLPTDNIIPIKMEHWTRNMIWKDTKLSWIPPSPNIPTPNTALLYGATVFLEATTISEGRGTTTPFEIFGAPFLNAIDVAERLNSDFKCSSTSSAFRSAYYQPTFSKYNGTTIAGAQWVHDSLNCQQSQIYEDFDIIENDKNTYKLQSTKQNNIFLDGTRILYALKNLSNPPTSFQWDGSWFGHPGTELIDQYAGTPIYREMLDNGNTPDEIMEYFKNDELLFQKTRKSILLY